MAPALVDGEVTSFWCGVCEARVPCSLQRADERKRQHMEVHDNFARERELFDVTADVVDVIPAEAYL